MLIITNLLLMKKILLIVLLVFLPALAAVINAADPYFSSLSTKEGFDYTYVSPSMLKMMGKKVVNSDLNIRASDINSIETVSTVGKGTDDELWKGIRSIKNKLKLETLTTKKEENYRYDVLGKLSGDNRFITRLMVITQNTGANVSVVYIEGKIPLGEVMLKF